MNNENPVPEAAAPDMAARHRRIGWMVLGTLAVLLILIIGVIIAVRSPKPAFRMTEQQLAFEYAEEEDVTFIVYKNKLLDETIDGFVITTQTSLDGGITAVLNSANELYIIDGKSMRKAAGGVVEYRLASGGGTVAYIQEDGVTSLYDIKKSARSVIETERYCSALTLSPDGGTLMLLRESELGTDVLCVYKNGKLTELAAHALPIAVADNAKYAYFCDSESQALFVSKKLREPVLLSDDFTKNYGASFDETLEEILYTTESGVMVSVKGGEAVSLHDAEAGIDLLCPENAAVTVCGDAHVTARIYPVKTLGEQLYLMEYLGREGADLLAVGEDFTAEMKLYGWQFSITPDKSAVYFIRDFSLYRADTMDFAETMLSADVTDYRMLGYGEHIYCLDCDGRLTYLDSDGEVRDIAEAVGKMIALGDKRVAFTAAGEDGGYDTLYYSQKGGKMRRVAENIGELNTEAGFVTWRIDSEELDSYELWRFGGSGSAKRLRKSADE